MAASGSGKAGVDELIEQVPAGVRPIVKAARTLVTSVAPKSAVEIPYNSKPPASKSFMWKLVRYSIDGTNVLGIGTFSKYSTIFFYRGRELDDGRGLLQGSGKDSRFMPIHTVADVKNAAVKRLIEKAFRLASS